jgi:GTPase SAR1 family protein
MAKAKAKVVVEDVVHNNNLPLTVVEAATHTHTHPIVLFQTTLRQTITPYLPPPVLVAMRQIDSHLEPSIGMYIGPEPSMTVLGSFLLAVLLWQLVVRITNVARVLLGGGGGGHNALKDDDDDDNPTNILHGDTRYFDATLLLCGPSLAGKTALFYQLVHPPEPQQQNGLRLRQTVKSLKTNTGFVTITTNNNNVVWRVLDTPGHWGADKMISTVLLNNHSQKLQSIILVLDATQPVSKAADYLYALLVLQQSQSQQYNLLVACHKSKAPKAKNVRRLKLQLRTELERLSQLKEGATSHNWEEIMEDHVQFCATSCDPPLLQELETFLETGTVSPSS